MRESQCNQSLLARAGFAFFFSRLDSASRSPGKIDFFTPCVVRRREAMASLRHLLNDEFVFTQLDSAHGAIADSIAMRSDAPHAPPNGSAAAATSAHMNGIGVPRLAAMDDAVRAQGESARQFAALQGGQPQSAQSVSAPPRQSAGVAAAIGAVDQFSSVILDDGFTSNTLKRASHDRAQADVVRRTTETLFSRPRCGASCLCCAFLFLSFHFFYLRCFRSVLASPLPASSSPLFSPFVLFFFFFFFRLHFPSLLAAYISLPPHIEGSPCFA
jgi:hypothetical protein